MISYEYELQQSTLVYNIIYIFNEIIDIFIFV